MDKDETHRTRKNNKADILETSHGQRIYPPQAKHQAITHRTKYRPRGTRYILHSAGNVIKKLDAREETDGQHRERLSNLREAQKRREESAHS